jgi:hypothetical protein
MGHPRAVQGILDAPVAGLDDIDGDGADKGIEFLCLDRVDDALADLSRIETLVARRSDNTASSVGRICGPPMWSGRLRAPRGIFVLTGPGRTTGEPLSAEL